MILFSISRFFTILSLFAIPIVSKGTLFPFIVGKYAWFRGSIGLAFIVFLLGLIFSKEGGGYWERIVKVVKSPLGVAVAVFAVVFLLAVFFGFDPANSFWSNFERGEGGVQIIYLYLFFILLTTLFKDEKGWQKVLGWAVFVGFLSSLYGFLASFGVQDFIGSSFKESGDAYRFQGSLGNSAYVAVYSIFLIFYAAYLLITEERKSLKRNFIKTGLIILSMLIFASTFVLAATRGAFLAVLASLFISLVFVMLTSKKWRKPIGIVMFCGVILFGSLFYFKNTSFVKSLPGSRIFDVSFSTKTFGHRTIMWSVAFEGFKDRPILGWGPENYYQIFDRHFDTRYFNPPESFGAWFDRAHSLIFDYLAEIGVLGLAAFLGIFATFYVLFFLYSRKTNERGEVFLSGSPFVRGLFFALPVAYFIQGLVLFDILVTYMNLFLFMALTNYYFISHSGSENKKILTTNNQETRRF